MKAIRLALVPAVGVALALGGCGHSVAPTTPGAAAPSVSSPASSATVAGGGATAAATTAAPSDCPTENTRSFAKTRLAADLGLTAGTFHRYIYKPWKAGTFNKGAHGRTLAIAKAVGIAALDAKLVANATANVKANPTLCNVLYQPLQSLGGEVSKLKSDVLSGNLGAIGSVEGLVSGLVSTATSSGLPVTETTDTSKAS